MANISTLQQSLINAKKVMNKVDGGGFSTGNVSLAQSNVTDSTGLMESSIPQPLPQSVPNVDIGGARQDLTPKSNLTEDRINNSRLPDIVKQAMINNPIPDIPFNGGDVVPPIGKTTKKISSKNLKSIIKESVKELLNETIGLKKESNENFQFRVGDRIFYGKITSSKTVK